MDGNGSISATEMKIVLGKMGEPNDDATVSELIDLVQSNWYDLRLILLVVDCI